jgi:hypothetical protein
MDKRRPEKGIRRQSAQTSAQLVAFVDGDEHAASQSEWTNADDLWRTAARNTRLERLPRD